MANPTLVVIFLRGGADALSLVSPTGDTDYITARPEALRVLRKGDDAGHTLSDGLADVDFRLHPVAGGLADLFHAGDLSIIHATGLLEATRSHFDAEARIERAASGAGDSGWLGRYLLHTTPGGPLPALGVGTSLPEALRGARAAVAPDLRDLMIGGDHWLAPALRARLAEGFGAHAGLGPTTADLLTLNDVLQDRLWSASDNALATYSPTIDYPDSPLSGPLMTVAQTIKTGLGLRIATVDYGGWDTHAHQTADFPGLVRGLDLGLMAFWRDLGVHQQDVSVVVMSEFGRRLRSNDSGGTDHGRAGAMFVLGPQARGGRLLGRWPGLDNAALEDGADLAVTTDYRAVLGELLTGHMGLSEVGAVFPGLVAPPVGLFT